MSIAPHLHVTFESETARALAKLVRRKQIPDAKILVTPERFFLGDLTAAESGTTRLESLRALDPARFDPWYVEPDAASIFSAAIDAFWRDVKAWSGAGTIWYSSASAQEWCGLITALHVAPNARDFDIIDVHVLPGKTQHRSSADLSLDALKAALPYAAKLSAHDRSDHLARFQSVAPAPLRFVRGGQLLSGALDTHDADIESELEAEYQSSALVVSRLISAYPGEALQADEVFYASRLKALAQSGVIDARGDAYELDASEVRDSTPAADMLDGNRLHITGSVAALGLVRQYAMAMNRPIRNFDETRTLFPSLGPLNTIAVPDARADWFDTSKTDVHHHMGLTSQDRPAMIADWHQLWAKLDRWSGPVTLWLNRRSAADASFLLAVAKHCPRAVAFDIVDFADPDLANPPLPNVERARPDQVAAAARRAFRLTEAEIDALQKDYDRLARETKGMRCFKAGKLTDVPLDYFDKRILKIAGVSGRRLTRVMEDVLAEEGDEGYDQADHYFWLWRFDVLVKAGELAISGKDPDDWRVKRVKPSRA